MTSNPEGRSLFVIAERAITFIFAWKNRVDNQLVNLYNVIMKFINWNKQKNEWLKKERQISFEIVAALIESKQILEIIEHPHSEKYPNQRLFIINYQNYAYLVPFVEDESQIFLKTIIPSRKATQKYLKGEQDG